MNGNRENCPMRHENGNCTVAGGFCTAVNGPICEALHNAFDCGYRSAIHARQKVESKLKVVESNEPLTLDELREAIDAGDPVWLVGLENGDRWVHIDGIDSLVIRFSVVGNPETWCFRTASYGVRVWAYHQKRKEN